MAVTVTNISGKFDLGKMPIAEEQFENVWRVQDDEAGLKAFIAIHSSMLGPAMGGCRMYNYLDDKSAIRDCLRLAHDMTWRNALIDIPHGGGACVVIGNPNVNKTPELLASLAAAVNALDGQYIATEDMGINQNDMITLHGTTAHVAGLKTLNPDAELPPYTQTASYMTAYGVYQAICEAAAYKYGRDSSMEGRTVAIQGLGSVGLTLARLLHESGARIVASDISETRRNYAAKHMNRVQILHENEIFSTEADIFAPCAFGNIISTSTLPQLNVDIVAGSASNQLASKHMHARIKDSGILYIPDFVINGGGMICAAYERFRRIGENPFDHDIDQDNMKGHVISIRDTLAGILSLAASENVPPVIVADRRARNVVASAAEAA